MTADQAAHAPTAWHLTRAAENLYVAHPAKGK